LTKLRLGLIGAGQIAKTHIVAFSALPALYSDTDGYELEMVAEVTDERAKAAARRFGFRRWTSDWRMVTKDSHVDLVDIITPTYLHKAPAIDAAEHGKNVLCEKPAATNSLDAEKMYRAAEKAGVIHMVGFNYRRVSAVTFAREIIQRNELGRIYHVRCQFLEDFSSNPSAPATWRYRASTAGSGALADLGSHAIDMVRYVFAQPESVCAARQTFIHGRPMKGARTRKGRVNVDDATVSLLRFKEDAIGVVQASWVATGRKVGLEFEAHGSKGSLYFNMERPNELQVYMNDDPPELRGYRTVLTGPLHPYSEGLVLGSPSVGMGYVDSMVNQIHDLTLAIRHHKLVTPTFYDGWKAQQVLDAIIESSERRSWVDVPRS
jgi:predicted dehydrogenase